MANLARLTLLVPRQYMPVGAMKASQAVVLALGSALRGRPGTGNERRHAFAAPYSYTGTATAGTADSASGWTVTRISIAANGTTTVTHATGAWTDRSSLTYV